MLLSMHLAKNKKAKFSFQVYKHDTACMKTMGNRLRYQGTHTLREKERGREGERKREREGGREREREGGKERGEREGERDVHRTYFCVHSDLRRYDTHTLC